MFFGAEVFVSIAEFMSFIQYEEDAEEQEEDNEEIN